MVFCFFSTSQVNALWMFTEAFWCFLSCSFSVLLLIIFNIQLAFWWLVVSVFKKPCNIFTKFICRALRNHSEWGPVDSLEFLTLYLKLGLPFSIYSTLHFIASNIICHFISQSLLTRPFSPTFCSWISPFFPNNFMQTATSVTWLSGLFSKSLMNMQNVIGTGTNPNAVSPVTFLYFLTLKNGHLQLSVFISLSCTSFLWELSLLPLKQFYFCMNWWWGTFWQMLSAKETVNKPCLPHTYRCFRYFASLLKAMLTILQYIIFIYATTFVEDLAFDNTNMYIVQILLIYQTQSLCITALPLLAFVINITVVSKQDLYEQLTPFPFPS